MYFYIAKGGRRAGPKSRRSSENKTCTPKSNAKTATHAAATRATMCAVQKPTPDHTPCPSPASSEESSLSSFASFSSDTVST